MPNKWNKEDLVKLDALSNSDAVSLLQQIMKSDDLNKWESDALPDMLKRFKNSDFDPSPKAIRDHPKRCL